MSLLRMRGWWSSPKGSWSIWMKRSFRPSQTSFMRDRAMCRWVLESVAPEVLQQSMRAWGKILAQAHAEWKFAPPSGLDFFRQHGWSPTVQRPFFVEARRLHRDKEMRFALLVRALSALSGRFRRRLEDLGRLRRHGAWLRGLSDTTGCFTVTMVAVVVPL